MDIMKYAKALVPVVVGFVLYLLNQLGVSSGVSVEQGVTLAVTAGLVWLVPNQK